MTRNRRITLFFVLVAGILLWVVLQRPRGLNWSESYDLSSRSPYGTQVVYQALQRQYADRTIERPEDLVRTLTDEAYAEDGSTYFFLGYGWSVGAAEAAALSDYVAAGHDALVIARHIPADFLTEYLGFGGCATTSTFTSYESMTVMNQRLELRHPDLDGEAVVQLVEDYDTVYTRWQYFQWADVCDTIAEWVRLGDLTGGGEYYPNFVAIRHGQGRFLLHTTPLAFSNYHAIDTSNQAYISQVLAHLQGSDGTIYWDTRHQIMGQPGPIVSSEGEGGGRGPQARFSDQTPLAYILSQPPLAWAWYTLLATAVLYVWFGAKRRQRAIPVREPRENTTLEFIETVGTLRWQQKQHGGLMMSQYKLWIYDVNTRYGLSLNAHDLPDVDALQPLAKASGLPLAALEGLVAAFAECRNAPDRMTEGDLSRAYERLEAYYQARK